MTHPSNPQHGVAAGGAFAFARTGYSHAERHDLTTADVEDATVYGRDEETVGSVKSLNVDTDGKISHAVVDIGGFLGIGAHSVQLPFDEITVLRETDGTDVRLYVDTTKERLKDMPEHRA